MKSLLFFGALYFFLAAVVVWMLFHQIGASPGRTGAAQQWRGAG